MPSAHVEGDEVRIQNVRNCLYFREDVYATRYEDRIYRLSDLQTVDFIVVPFSATSRLAHTMLSFGFADGRYLALSVEARLEEGESYSAVRGGLRQFELIYILGDEKDLISLRTEHRNADVYVYRTQVPPEQIRLLFVDVLARVNQLKEQPEFYDTLSNNCTTNIVRHVNRVRPGRIPPSLGLILTGHSDRLAYDLGLLDTGRPFAELRASAHVNTLAHRFRDAPDFSDRIRR
jgi:hypothetical protein